MDFLNNTNVRHAIFLVAGTFLGYFGTGFMSQDSDVDQVAVVDSSPANTAEAVVEVTPEPETTSSEEVNETPAEAPTVE
jgi:hypothetical protein